MDTLEHFRRRMGAQGEEAESAAEAPRAYGTALSQPSHVAGVASGEDAAGNVTPRSVDP